MKVKINRAHEATLDIPLDEAVSLMDQLRAGVARELLQRAEASTPAFSNARQELDVAARAYIVATAANVPDLEVQDKRARFHRAAVAFAEEAKAYR